MNEIKKLLFFDLEYASSAQGIHKICEFGYVVTDERFNLVKEGNIVINPDIPTQEWDGMVLRCILTRKLEEYLRSPVFSKVYFAIRDLFEECDLAVGHTADADAQALNDECLRYKLPSLDFAFYDVKLIYKRFAGVQEDVSVERLLGCLGIEGGNVNFHDAEVDAFDTMLICKKMAENSPSTTEFLRKYKIACSDETKNYRIASTAWRDIREEKEYLATLAGDGTPLLRGTRSLNRRRLIEYVDNLRVDVKSRVLRGKSIALSANYTVSRFTQTLNLARLIAENGGSFSVGFSRAEVFAEYPPQAGRHDLNEWFREAKRKGKTRAQVIPFSILLDRLGVTEAELDKMPHPSFEFMLDPQSFLFDKRDRKARDRILRGFPRT